MPMGISAIEYKTKDICEVQRKYVRYDVGAKLYGMCEKTFIKLAKDAKATCKYGKVVLVNTQIVDKFLETTCRIIED